MSAGNQMPETKRPLKVFVSYASQDKPAVRELSQRFAGEGWIDPWVDEKKLLPGQDWRTKIEEAVETSDTVIICLSSSSVGKEGFVQKELRYAREIAFEKPDETIFLIPLRLDDCIVPRGLRFYQWGDYFGEKKDDTYATLIEALKIRHEQKLKLEEEERARQEKERLEREAIEKAAREKAERETAERIAREKAEREAAEKEKREKAERQVARKAAMVQAFSKSFTSLISLLAKAKPFFRIVGAIGIVIALFLIGSWGIPKFAFLIPTAKASLTSTFYPSVTSTFTISPQPSTKTLTPKPTTTKTQTPIPTVTLPALYTDEKGVSMVLVPAGEFTMGNDNGNGDPFDGPVHKINLNSFYVDKYEVTNGHYKDCVDAGVCQAPTQRSSMKIPSYYGSTKFKDYPVTWVDWNMAKTYCEWRGAHLPTEAEWEKAARGIDGREFPWEKVGVIIDKTYANYGNLVGDFTAVGSYEKGKSPYGAYDMAGNVFEWVADWFSWDYYSISPYQNPLGPETGDYHVYRGGGVGSDPAFVRTTSRQWFDSSLGSITLGIGIRCARDANP
jgi:formylglycine-generating enzyme required for sulfatase activity